MRTDPSLHMMDLLFEGMLPLNALWIGNWPRFHTNPLFTMADIG